jgi:hypothetical protein
MNISSLDGDVDDVVDGSSDFIDENGEQYPPNNTLLKVLSNKPELNI